MRIVYPTIHDLIEKRLAKSEPELSRTTRLFKKMALAKKKGWFSKNTLMEMWLWKNECSRFVNHIYPYCDDNTEQKAREISAEVFNTDNDEKRMRSLLKLTGIRIPTASTILMFLDPERYGVIDIHVWRTLYHYKLVKAKPDGSNLSVDNWLRAISILRDLQSRLSKKYLSITVRKIEKVIFEYGQMQARSK